MRSNELPLTIVPERTLFGKLTGVTVKGSILRGSTGDLSEALERFRSHICSHLEHPLAPALHLLGDRSINFRGYPNENKSAEIIVQGFGVDAQESSAEILLYELSSRFLDIKDGRLRSELTVRTAPALRPISPVLAPLYLGKILPFSLTRLVLGWQYFQARGLGARFGFAPFPTLSGTIRVGERLDYEVVFPATGLGELIHGQPGTTLRSLDSFTTGAPITEALTAAVGLT